MREAVFLFSNTEEKEIGMFNFETKTVTLNSGYVMPLNGLGTYSLHGETCVNSIKSALASGVRLIDTASAYGNEEEVGQAIREAMEEFGIQREEIFVTTKIYPGSEMANPERSIQACLDRLDIGYVDLMLLHHPDRNDVKAYQAMEKFVEEGKIRSIGLCNWYVKELEEFLPQVTIPPALVQNEIHPYYQENDVIPYIQDLGIVVQGWYPLGGRGHTAELLGDELYGNTRYVAAMIQRRTGGEGHRNGVRPKLASRVDSMDDYSVIFLGYPIWYNGRVFLLGGI